jgi:transposase
MENLNVALKEKYNALKIHLDERSLRLCAAADARVIGRGGVSSIARASGMSRTTIHVGLKDLDNGTRSKKIRRAGAGRKSLVETDPDISLSLEKLIDPVTRGDPESPLRWTSKSTTNLAQELTAIGHSISQRSVWNLLDELGYSMQSNRKSNEGSNHPDRDAQFQFIAANVATFLEAGLPVISVDTKKKELIGNYRNVGSEWEKKGNPQKVNTYDFMDKELGKVAPYGVYDIAQNKGWVNVGISKDTAEFAVESIRRWWYAMGCTIYKDADQLMITADGGGSNGSRVRLWKIKLQDLANELNKTILVRHFPPGTSKWNKIEHRMFCHITENWRGRPLISREAVVQLIGATTTAAGLEIKAMLDENSYQSGIKVSNEEIQNVNIHRDEFHGEWNYEIRPKPDTNLNSL